MRDAATPPDDGHDAAPDGTPTTPQQRAAAIRAAAGEILARLQEWRNSPHWRDNESNRRRYQVTVDAIASLDRLLDPEPQETVLPLVDAIVPVLAAWRLSRPGPEQAIFVHVERLQRLIG